MNINKSGIGYLLVLLIGVLGVIGWFSNLFNLIHGHQGTTGLLVAEILGVIFFPIGMVLGWIYF